MSNKFNTFDNTTSPTVSDYQVGYGQVSSITKEKRWLVSTWKTFWQGILNITRLDRENDNYVDITGSSTGSGLVTITALGSDANVEINLNPKGTGSVKANGVLTSNGNELSSGGGVITSQGGEVSTTGGNVNVGAGQFLGSNGMALSGGTITLTGSTGINISGSGGITVATGNITATGGVVVTDSLQSSSTGTVEVNDDFVVVGNAEISGGALTVQQIDALVPGFGITVSGIQSGLNVATSSSLQAVKDVMTLGFQRPSINIGLTADVTSVQGGGLINRQVNQYSTVANVGDCATLPVITDVVYNGFSPAPFAVTVIIRNDGANSMDIFPNTSGIINGGAANAAIALAAGSQVTLYGYRNAGVDTWFTIG